MRPWASWTAKTAVFSLAAGLAATAVGSAAWAASGSGADVALAARVVVVLAATGGAALAVRGGGPNCHGDDCGPGCQGSHCAPGGNPGGNPNGTGPGTTTTVTNATGPVSGSLPTTGADLLLLGVAAVGTIGVGAGAVTLARRRRNGEAA